MRESRKPSISRKLIPLALIVAASALVVATAVSQARPRGPDDLKAPEGDPGLDILACYLAEEIDGRNAQKKAVMVTDNFGKDDVLIGDTILLCESAQKTKFPTGSTAFPAETLGQPGKYVFQCFEVRKGATPDDDVRLTTHNFGPENVTVMQAEHMCEGARKTHGVDIEAGRPGHLALYCYDVNDLEEPPIDHGDPAVVGFELLTDNFGVSPVDLNLTDSMCEEAQKKSANERDVGRPSGRVWQCIDAAESPDIGREVDVTLETANFGPIKVTVTELVMMCERAKKDHIFTATFSPVPTPDRP